MSESNQPRPLTHKPLWSEGPYFWVAVFAIAIGLGVMTWNFMRVPGSTGEIQQARPVQSFDPATGVTIQQAEALGLDEHPHEHPIAVDPEIIEASPFEGLSDATTEAFGGNGTVPSTTTPPQPSTTVSAPTTALPSTTVAPAPQPTTETTLHSGPPITTTATETTLISGPPSDVDPSMTATESLSQGLASMGGR